ncbi:hypothetical protein BDAP_000805 [Binucleata daphniae]
MQKLSRLLYDKKFDLHSFWIQQAKNHVTKNMNEHEKSIFDKHNYIDCLFKIGEHEVNKLLCKDYLGEVHVFKAIEKYNEYGFEECVDLKNEMYFADIFFEIPLIGFGTVLI